jgi:sortase A
MRRLLRVVGTLLAIGGAGLLVWAFVVWQWEDPVTSLYTHLEQRGLERGYEERRAAFADDLRPPASQTAGAEEPAEDPSERLGELAERYRAALGEGDAVGRLTVPRLGLDIVVVEGTRDDTLRRGPGRYSDLYVPGEGQLVYVAGHRTTYSAPFSRIDDLRPGDEVVLDLPYARFEYEITEHRIVRDTELSVLESQGREVLALQACHPRFFATHRYIAYAEPVRVTDPQGNEIALGSEAAASQSGR